MRACETCPLLDSCRIRVPKRTYGGFSPLIGHGCAFYTCPDGVKAARRALASGDAQTILVDDEPMTVYIFGSPSKPTDDPDAEVHRYVSPPGEIWATSPDGNSIVFTGQTTEFLAEVWRMSP